MAKIINNQTIRYLTDLMATISNAYFKGRNLGALRVHETGEVGISIDLYAFDRMGIDLIDGLQSITPEHGPDIPQETGWVFNIGYDPDDECPLFFIFHPDNGGEDYTILPHTLSDTVLIAITQWLKKVIHLKSAKPCNETTSFFFYMWNAWCKEECQKVYGNAWQHFWSKWCGICERHVRFGAAENFYAELSNHNRDLLVKRATELYEGQEEKYKK